MFLKWNPCCAVWFMMRSIIVYRFICCRVESASATLKFFAPASADPHSLVLRRLVEFMYFHIIFLYFQWLCFLKWGEECIQKTHFINIKMLLLEIRNFYSFWITFFIKLKPSFALHFLFCFKILNYFIFRKLSKIKMPFWSVEKNVIQLQ